MVGHDPELALKQLERHYPGRFLLCEDSEEFMESMFYLEDRYGVEDTPYDKDADQIDEGCLEAMELKRKLP